MSAPQMVYVVVLPFYSRAGDRPRLHRIMARRTANGWKLARRDTAWGYRLVVRADEAHATREGAWDAWRTDTQAAIVASGQRLAALRASLAHETPEGWEPEPEPPCDAPVSRIESVAEPNRWLSIAERIADQSSGWKP